MPRMAVFAFATTLMLTTDGLARSTSAVKSGRFAAAVAATAGAAMPAGAVAACALAIVLASKCE